MKYMGMKFKNYEEFKAWNKAGHIEEYKRLSELFAEKPSVELACFMSDRAEVLVNQFGMTWEEVEALEIA